MNPNPRMWIVTVLAAGLCVGLSPTYAQLANPAPGPGGTPDYFGTTPNYALSSLPPTVGFSGGGGDGAVAVPTVQAGVITAVKVLNGGAGFTSAPTVAFTSLDGAGATATAVVNGVGTVTMTDGGGGYSAAATVTFSAPGGTGATATGTPNVVNGVITGVTITNSGSGYTQPPTVTFADAGGGRRATGTAAI
ncbi:MAG: hypothetical protein PHU85_19345, partial [Phycisphaerae bacterium]|nr:hypothetical protein [Phycisphaerae bacterium]